MFFITGRDRTMEEVLVRRGFVMKTILIFCIRVYRKFLSPLKPGSCRFYPTCSLYAIQAIEKYGWWKGTCLSIKRISKCHPFHPGGYDPVP